MAIVKQEDCMKPDNNAWITLFDPLFEENKYLYHFTSIHSAQRILNSNSLKFSKLSRTNDTLESKPKFSKSNFSEIEDFSEAIERFNYINANLIQLLCFSLDTEKQPTTEDRFIKYADFSGRGFAFPRMWAQYADNNTGLCLVFNKSKLINLIEEQLDIRLIRHEEVCYRSQFVHHYFDIERLRDLSHSIKALPNSISDGLYIRSFLKTNPDFTKYNYFIKLDDWKNENEYRFLAIGENDYYIKGISEALSGVVVGEKIDDSDLKVVKLFCKSVCEIKQISFTFRNCQLRTIYNCEV